MSKITSHFLPPFYCLKTPIFLHNFRQNVHRWLRMLLAASSLLVSLSMAGLATYLTLLASVPPGLKWLPLLLAGLNI